MAKKNKLFGTVALIGTLAGATVAVYSKRKEIRALIEEAAARFLPAQDAQEAEAERWEENDDTDIVIDRTSGAKAQENEAEETPAE